MDNSTNTDRGPAKDYYIVTTRGIVKFLGWHLPEREKPNWHYYESVKPVPNILHFRKEHMVSVAESICVGA